MNWKRLLRHLSTPDWLARRHFPAPALERIGAAIGAAEKTHGGEICFALEAALDPWRLLHDCPARERALEVFAQMGVWDTEDNCGVLLYLLLADHDIEIVADRGIARKVPQEQWDTICQRMEERFRQGQFESGVIEGIEALSNLLRVHYPPAGDRGNELANEPRLL